MAVVTGVEDVPGRHYQKTYINGQATIGTADDWPIFEASASPVLIKRIGLIFAAAITGAATHNFALQVLNKGGAGAGSTAVTDVLTFGSGTDAVAYDAKELVLSATEANLALAKGDVLALVRTINGNGLAQPDCMVVVEYEPK